MTETSTSMPSRLAAAPAYISQATVTTEVGRHGRCGAGVYWRIASAGDDCGRGVCGVPCGHEAGWYEADGGVGPPGGPPTGGPDPGSPDLNVGAPPGACRAVMFAVAIAWYPSCTMPLCPTPAGPTPACPGPARPVGENPPGAIPGATMLPGGPSPAGAPSPGPAAALPIAPAATPDAGPAAGGACVG